MTERSNRLERRGAFCLLAFLSLVIFAADAFVAFALRPVAFQSALLESFIDAGLLTLALFPALYFVVRKFVRQNKMLKTAESSLRAAHIDPDERVGERAREIEGVKQELEDSLRRFTDIAETAGDWIWEMDADLRFSFISPRFFEIFPIADDEFIGKTRQELAGASAENEHWREHLDDLANHRPFREFKYPIAMPDGSTRHILTNGKPVFNADGVFTGYRGTGTDKTVEVEARKALEESEEQFRNLIEGSIQGVLIHKDWKILFANQALADIFGYESADETLTLENLEPMIAPDELERLRGYKLARQSGQYAPELYETRCVKKDGSFIWAEFRNKKVDWHGIAATQCVVVDITERKKAEESLRQQIERFNAALENMSQGLCMFDDKQRLILCNDHYARMYGLSPEQVKPGTTLRQILEYRIANDIYAGGSPEEYLNERQQWVTRGKRDSKVQELNDGRTIAITHQPMSEGGWLTTHEDITDFRRIEERLEYLAHHDALTDMPNRVLLQERLEEELKRSRRGDGFALLCIDLDGFKGVNDALGHAAGDQLLKIVAERLRNCIRETDMVARLGGDEFAIIQVAMERPTDATVLASRICDAMYAPFDLGGHEEVVGTSIGIAIAPRDGGDPDQLLKNADIALYRAKRDGRGIYRLFEPEMKTSSEDRHALALDLRKALGNGELEVYYQPLVNLEKNRVNGFEALLRWHHPERGPVPPADFIPLAEEIGVIKKLGRWVLHQACAEAAAWPDNIKVAVNVSPVQFRGGQLLLAVTSALGASGLSPGRLELEVTESVLLQEEEATLARLHQLHDLGVRISLDDFGTGYSSLSYLRRFPFDKIKIDASFVSDLCHENDGIVQAIVRLASGLGMETTAEGVETKEQLEIIRAEGCTEAQGYLFSPPRPAKEISRRFPRRAAGIESAA